MLPRALVAALILLGSPVLAAGPVTIHTMLLGNEAICLRDTVQLTRAEDGEVISAAISPDGKTVAFLAGNADKAGLCLGKTLGGRPAAVLTSGQVWHLRSTEIAWSPDGKLFALTADKLSTQNGKPAELEHVLILDSAGKEKAAFPIPEGFRSSLTPLFSPDSRGIAIAVGSLKEPVVNILVFDLDKSSTRVYKTVTYTDLARWTEDGTKLDYSSLAAAPNGESQFNIRELDLADESDKVVGKPAPRRPSLSPDGKWRAMPSEDGLIVEDQQTAAGKTLVKASWPGVLGWAPNGKLIAYLLPDSVSDQYKQRTRDLRQLWLAGVETHKLNTMLLALDVAPEMKPSWSADSSKVAYVSWGRLMLAELSRRRARPEEKLTAGLPLAEEDEKALIETNARAISGAFGQFLLDQSRLPSSLDEIYSYLGKEPFLRPGAQEVIFTYAATPGAAINMVGNDTVIGELDAGFKWKVVVYLGERVEVVDKE